MKVITEGGAELVLGTVETTPTISLIDYSRRVTDDFGITTVVKRGFARRLSVRLALPTDDVDSVQQQLAGLRATPAQWIADDRFAWLSAHGFYKDFELDLAVPPLSYCTLTVEGFAETETVPDAGGDPAPAGTPSTLRLLQPVEVTSSVLSGSSVPENDHPEWSAVVNYGAGERVIKTSTHRVYESAAGGNLGHDPAAASGRWLDVGPTNRWAMFDQAVGTKTAVDGPISVTLNVSGINAVALLDVTGSSVRVQAAGYDRTLSVEAGAVLFLDLPNVTGQVTVTVQAPAHAAVGTLLIGHAVALGLTEASPTAGITDFSRKEVDDFGEVTVVPRSWAKRMSLRAAIRTDAVDLVANRIASVRGTPSLWIGDTDLDSLTVYGFFKDVSIEVGESVSTLSLSIEGLSEASPVGVLAPNWTDIVDNDPIARPKPEDGATVGAPPGTPVGDRPAEEVTSQLDAQAVQLNAQAVSIDDILVDVDGLFTTYGSTASAAASAETAATQAGIAVGAANTVKAVTLPSTFDAGAEFFTRNYSLNPASAPPLDGWTFPTVAGVGTVARADGGAISGHETLASRGWVQVKPNRTYRCLMTARQTIAPTSGGSQMVAEILGYNADGTYTASPGRSLVAGEQGVTGNYLATVTPAHGWQTFGWIWESGANPAHAYIRPYGLVNWLNGNGAAEVRLLVLEDITESATASAASVTATQKAQVATDGAATATTQANLAVSAGNAIKAITLPSTFDAGAEFFSRDITSPPSTAAPLNGWTLPTVAGVGVVARADGAAISGHDQIVTRGWMPVKPNRVYRALVIMRQTIAPTVGGSQTDTVILAFNADGSYSGQYAGRAMTAGEGPVTKNYSTSLTPAEGWQTFGWIYDSGPNPAFAFIRPYSLVNYNGGNGAVEIRQFLLEDITESEAAKTQAGIAATHVASASGHAAAALSSANLSASIMGKSLPGDFLERGRYWIGWYTDIYNPTIHASKAVKDAAFYDVAGVGRVFDARYHYLSGGDPNAYLGNKGTLPLVAGRTYRFTVRAAVFGNVTNIRPYFNFYDANGNNTGYTQWTFKPQTPAQGWVTHVLTYKHGTDPIQYNGGGNHAQIGAMSDSAGNTGAIADGTGNIQYLLYKLEDITDLAPVEAAVKNEAGAIVEVGKRAMAFAQQTVNAGADSTAFVQLKAETAPGAVTSNVSLGARELHMYNPGPSGDAWVRALSITGGNAELTGGLRAGTYIRLGSGVAWNVALQPKDFAAYDGQVISFGVNLGNVPALQFALNNLAALAAGETYSVYAENLTSTGFTLRAKIITPATPANYSVTNDVDVSTTYGTVNRSVGNGGNPASATGNYTFSLQITGSVVNERDPEPLPGGDYNYYAGQGTVVIGIWAYRSGAWQKVTTITDYFVGADGGAAKTSINVTRSYTVQMGAHPETFGAGIDSRAGMSAATLWDIPSVSWQGGGTPGSTRTATPNNQLTTITVRPQ